jgi:hypothetical protein
MQSRVLAVAAIAAGVVLPAGAEAQGLADAQLRGAPQFISYSIELGGAKTSVSQFAIPIAFSLPLTTQLTFDIATAFANASVDAGGGATSKISGLTDAQARLNYTLAGDAVVVTAGLNLPSGQYKVAEDKIGAAGQIGNDFLAFPVSSFGNGFAATGGIALARSAGDWNLGAGASFRKSMEFDAFEAGSSTVQFTPANEIRFRVGGDREIGGGRMMLGLIFSKFGEDTCDGGDCGIASTYATGDRIIVQGAVDVPVGERRLYIGGWFLRRGEGEQLGGISPASNIENVQVALGMNVGTLFIEPSVELRMQQISGGTGSTIVYGGLRSRFTGGAFELSPSVAYGVGSLGDADLSGLKVGLTIRLAR